LYQLPEESDTEGSGEKDEGEAGHDRRIGKLTVPDIVSQVFLGVVWQ
jgi:hypothetical protein